MGEGLSPGLENQEERHRLERELQEVNWSIKNIEMMYLVGDDEIFLSKIDYKDHPEYLKQRRMAIKVKLYQLAQGEQGKEE